MTKQSPTKVVRVDQRVADLLSDLGQSNTLAGSRLLAAALERDAALRDALTDAICAPDDEE